MIGSHSRTLSAAIADRPTPPAPNTALERPGCASSALSTVPAPVSTPQPSGATTSRGVSGGTFTT